MFGNGLYNPYILNNTVSRFGVKSFLSKLNIGSFLNSANKTLNVINQAIPIYNQVKPMLSNAKTVFKVISAMKDTDNSTQNVSESNNEQAKLNKNNINSNTTNNGPTFFI